MSSSTLAIDFNIQQVSLPKSYNFDPTVSETGLAAWMYYETNDAITAHSHIALYHENKFIDLTKELVASFNAAIKPAVHSNRIVFVANALQINHDDINWVLREVPNRDDGDIKELPALYRAYEEGGEQRLEAVGGTEIVSTNELIVPQVGLDTNAARRAPSGRAEIWSWEIGAADVERVSYDGRNDFSPSIWGDRIVWQKAKGWPFGWEIMAKVGSEQMQLTTNYYYDMGPKVYGDKMVWYGWDGYDYEIYMFDIAKGEIIQITSNRYDDVAPVIWGDVIAWEGYAAVESDIFIWKDGVITKISSNIDDDLYPRIWNNKIVWQGYDGDDFEIYFYDISKGGDAIKLTSNKYDDTNPDIHDNLVVWMGYHDNLDAEIFYLDLNNFNVADIRPVQLTNNEEDDRDVKTASRRIIWVTEMDSQSHIMLAEPR